MLKKGKTHSVVLALTAAALMGTMPVMVLAQEPAASQNESVDTAAENGFILTIATAEDLVQFAKSVNEDQLDYTGKTVTLTDDIDLSGYGSWTPIGTAVRNGSQFKDGTVFTGTFDGNGKTIQNLHVGDVASVDQGAGLFGAVIGTLKNVKFENVSVDTYSKSAGALVGMLGSGSEVSNIQILSGTVAGAQAAGGVAGRLIRYGTIEDCSNAAVVKSKSTNVGGIVGAAYYNSTDEELLIQNCTNTGAVSGTSCVGGIVGLNAGSIENCLNTANITGNGYSIGGIAGEQQSSGVVENNENTGDIANQSMASSSFGIGGIVGWVRYNGADADYPNKEVIQVVGNKNSGTISSQTTGAGGIVGVVYNAADIYWNVNTAPSVSAVNFTAGIAGDLQNSPFNTYYNDYLIHVYENVSTTPKEDLSGSCADLFAYNNTVNDPNGKFIVERNYTKLVQVTVKYEDEDGTELADSKMIECIPGMTLKEQALEIEGYTCADAEKTLDIDEEMMEDGAEIVFVYQEDDETPAEPEPSVPDTPSSPVVKPNPPVTTPEETKEPGLHTDEQGNIQYVEPDGTLAKNTFKKVDGVTYYFDQNGCAVKGFQTIDQQTYYFDAKGAMQTGWTCIASKNGTENWYYFKDSGAMHTGWLQDRNDWYYLNENGTMKTGWANLTYQGKEGRYFFDQAGHMKTGWLNWNDSWYYLDHSGNMKTGWLNWNGTWYLMQKDGVMKTGFAEVDGRTYFMDHSGAMKTGWLYLNDQYYFFDQSGAMKTGWMTLDGVSYYFNSFGVMATGWQNIEYNGQVHSYYFDPESGAMAADTVVDGIVIDSEGIAQN